MLKITYRNKIFTMDSKEIVNSVDYDEIKQLEKLCNDNSMCCNVEMWKLQKNDRSIKTVYAIGDINIKIGNVLITGSDFEITGNIINFYGE